MLSHYQDLKGKSYKKEIETVISACIYAASHDTRLSIEKLRNLRDYHQTNLSQGDYDKRTPLHVAVTRDNLELVKFLVEECKVNINSVDRWGSTPLSDAQSSK